ncbi:acyl-CoA dehydrogenase family protein [Nocardia sp. NPDC003963]
MCDEVNGPGISPDEIRAALRDYFSERPGIVAVRRNRDENGTDAAGFDREGWKVLVEQLGLLGIAAPEHWGGLGLEAEYLVAAMEECGATLYPGPLRASVLTAAALGGTSPEAVPAEFRETIVALLAGAAVAGVSTRSDRISVPNYRDGRVSGRLAAVTHGAVADLALCIVDTPDGPALALVATGSAQRRPVPTVDFATPLADVVLAGESAILLTAAGDDGALEKQLALETLLSAAELVGGAEGCLTQMVDYAKVREQFGSLIGAYQAVQHHCARTAVANAGARALVAGAARMWDRYDYPAARQLTLLARADAADAFTSASSTLIQICGGIGFTWEHDAHLFFRRARATAAIGGTPARIRDSAVGIGCLDLLVHEVA